MWRRGNCRKFHWVLTSRRSSLPLPCLHLLHLEQAIKARSIYFVEADLDRTVDKATELIALAKAEGLLGSCHPRRFEFLCRGKESTEEPKEVGTLHEIGFKFSTTPKAAESPTVFLII